MFLSWIKKEWFLNVRCCKLFNFLKFTFCKLFNFLKLTFCKPWNQWTFRIGGRLFDWFIEFFSFLFSPLVKSNKYYFKHILPFPVHVVEMPIINDLLSWFTNFPIWKKKSFLLILSVYNHGIFVTKEKWILKIIYQVQFIFFSLIKKIKFSYIYNFMF